MRRWDDARREYINRRVEINFCKLLLFIICDPGLQNQS